MHSTHTFASLAAAPVLTDDEARPALPVELWAYEHIWGKEAEGAPPLAADTIIDRCFEGIKDCDLFVFIVTGRHGTGAGYVEDNVAASYLELELFAAAVTDALTKNCISSPRRLRRWTSLRDD
jgi:hypothetical protein